MEFRIADTFTDSLTKLTGQEQKVVKTTAFDLQLDPANPSLRFHKLDRVKDPNFWSVSVNMDLRVIVHRTEASLMLCYVDHHDNAYNWASKRKIARHPKTGAAQLVEVRETIQEIIIPKTVEVETPKSKPANLFSHLSEEELLNYGIPPEWIQDVKTATEDTLFEIAEHLPQEAAEALLELATGGTPHPPVTASSDADPFAHPDAQRRFRVMGNQEELQRALDGIPLGKMDGLPSSRSAPLCRTPVQWPRPNLWFCWNRKNHCRLTSGSISSPTKSRGSDFTDHLFADLGDRPPPETQTTHWQRA